MKAAYKWRLENGIYGYLIDETGSSEPFSYSVSDYIRLYYGGIVVTGTSVDDGSISTIVSRMTKNEYINQFEEFKKFINQVYPQVSLLDVNYYYDIENDECTNSASSLKCSATDIIFKATAVSGTPVNAIVENEQPDPNSGDTLIYRIDFTIPPGEQGPVGATPDIEVGTVTTTTIAAGSNANVTVTRDPDSSDEAPVFDFEFEIPKGEGSSTIIGGQNIEAIITGTTGDEVVVNALGYRWDSEKESFAEGKTAISSGNYSHAEGINTVAYGIGSHAEGKIILTQNEGIFNYTGGTTEIITGVGTLVHLSSGDMIYFTNSNNTIGYIRKVLGASDERITIDNPIPYTIDNGNIFKLGGFSYGDFSHAEGFETKSYGEASHSEGSGTTAMGGYSHAEGFATTAETASSHAEGVATLASGVGSHAEGGSTESSGYYTHSEGHETEASGNYSHAEGYDTYAYGDSSHAEGESTEASGATSHAEGHDTHAYGVNSHAGGNNTIANQDNMTAIGKYNETYADSTITTLFVVGDGEANSRHNAFEVINEVSTDTTYSTRATVNSFDNVLLGMPIGSVVLWAGDTDGSGGSVSGGTPDGWLLCNGDPISVISASSDDYDFTLSNVYFKAEYDMYRPLCKVIGTKYGNSPISHRFPYINLPNIPSVSNMNYIIKYK